MSDAVRMGTRASALARAQSGAFAESFTAATGREVEVVIVRTEGDRLSVEGRAPSGGDITGVFTKALDDALREGRIDFAVHSLKDLPTTPEPGVALAAVPRRADARDALVVAARHAGVDTLAGLPEGARVATSSPRRIAQLLRLRPDLVTAPMAGNVDTRLRKLEEGLADALLLACAGLDRLGLGSRITRRLDPAELLGAPGQGALAVVCREDDDALRALLARLDDAPSRTTAEAERHFLNALRGGCRAPVGARATADGGLRILGRVLSPDGREMLEGEEAGEAHAEPAGRKLAASLLARGAGRLVAASRGAP